jgi:hypothetical protein
VGHHAVLRQVYRHVALRLDGLCEAPPQTCAACVWLSELLTPLAIRTSTPISHGDRRADSTNSEVASAPRRTQSAAFACSINLALNTHGANASAGSFHESVNACHDRLGAPGDRPGRLRMRAQLRLRVPAGPASARVREQPPLLLGLLLWQEH